MQVVKSVPEIFTSMPLSFTSSTSQVTTAPFLTSPGSANGSPSSCLTPSEMRSFSTSTSSTTALTMSPFLKLSITCSPGSFQSRSDRCTCLLYTSDAADDLLCVDLGGRRIIKKKKKI